MRAKLGVKCGHIQTIKGYRIWLVDKNKIMKTLM